MNDQQHDHELMQPQLLYDGQPGDRIEPGRGIDRLNALDDERRETEKRLRPRIYVASLSDYNAGRLHGAWIEAAQDPEDLGLEIKTMLELSPEPGAEEWAIHDHDEFGPARLSEYESLATVSAIATGLEQHGAPFGHWANLVGNSVEDLERFEEAYLGCYESIEAYGQQVADDLGLDDQLEAGIPEGLRHYVHIDYKRLGEDVSSELLVAQDASGQVILFHP
jgi:antirestriction protein